MEGLMIRRSSVQARPAPRMWPQLRRLAIVALSATDVVAQARGCDGSTQGTRSGSVAASIWTLTTIGS
jgi:hypothetical protein